MPRCGLRRGLPQAWVPWIGWPARQWCTHPHRTHIAAASASTPCQQQSRIYYDRSCSMASMIVARAAARPVQVRPAAWLACWTALSREMWGDADAPARLPPRHAVLRQAGGPAASLPGARPLHVLPQQAVHRRSGRRGACGGWRQSSRRRPVWCRPPRLPCRHAAACTSGPAAPFSHIFPLFSRPQTEEVVEEEEFVDEAEEVPTSVSSLTAAGSSSGCKCSSGGSSSGHGITTCKQQRHWLSQHRAVGTPISSGCQAASAPHNRACLARRIRSMACPRLHMPASRLSPSSLLPPPPPTPACPAPPAELC